MGISFSVSLLPRDLSALFNVLTITSELYRGRQKGWMGEEVRTAIMVRLWSCLVLWGPTNTREVVTP
jgi:hypothetical protein